MNHQTKITLLEEYRKGTISDIDKRALEVEALRDDFLFDALEGFGSNPTVETDDIKKRLYARISESKANANPIAKESIRRTLGFRIVSVAASFLLLASIFWWSTSLMSDESNVSSDQYADVIYEEKTANDPVYAEILEDGYDSEESVVTDERKEYHEEIVLDSNSEKDRKIGNAPTNPTPTVIAKRKKPSEDIEDMAEVSEKMEDLPVGDLNWESRIESDSDDEIVVSNAEIPKEIKAEEELEIIATSVMESEPDDAVSGARRQPAMKKSKKSSVQVQNSSEAISENSSSATPSIGKEAFDQYVKINRSQEFGERLYTISFELDNNSMPTKVQFPDNTSRKVKAEIKRLLREGSTWIDHAEKNERLTYTIRF